MKRLALVLVLVVALVFGLCSGIPLSYAMRNAGLVQQGIGWQQARGTIWDGQITGLSYRGKAVGAVDINSSPLSLFSGAITSDLNWIGQTGRARVRMRTALSSVELSGLAADIDIGQLDGIHNELRRIGGALKLSNATLRFDRAGRCVEATGTAQLDLVRRLGAQYGRDWPMLSGTPACVDDAIQLPLAGDGANGEHFEVTLRTLPDGRTGMDVHVVGLDAQATAALASIGFTKSGNGYTLRQESARAGERK